MDKTTYFPLRIKILRDERELLIISPEDIPTGERFVVVRDSDNFQENGPLVCLHSVFGPSCGFRESVF